MAKNEALSEFLIGKRASITPEMAGIPATGVRRVPGLRREEVATLAGVSVDWYVRLEQGRQITPSESVLSAIARILRMDDAERNYLFNLARPASGLQHARSARAAVRPGIQRMVQSLENQPAFVLGPLMEVIAGNELAWALLHDFSAHEPGDRNLLRWIMTDPAARDLYLHWSVIASEMTGVLQVESSANPNDEAIASLVGELSTSTPEFRLWWAQPNPQGRTSGVKKFRHPVVGELSIDWEAFSVTDDATQTLFIYTGSDQPSREALRLLSSWRATGDERDGRQQAAEGVRTERPRR